MSQIRIMELRGTYKGGGGPDKTILLSAARHEPNRFFVLVAYLRDPNDFGFQIGGMAGKLGIEHYFEVLDRSLLDLRCISQLCRLVARYDIQIIHVHDLKTTLLGVILKALNPKVKLMHTAHGWIVNSTVDRIKQKVQFPLLRLYPFHIAVSKATKNILVENGIRPKTIKVLHNSIDMDYWNTIGVRTSIRDEFAIPDDDFIIGTVGRLSREKDLVTFLNVAGRVLTVYPKAVFLIVGDGKGGIQEKLSFLARDIGIDRSIIFTGHRTDLKNIYASFDIFLTTSLTEGVPNTVLEAMSMEVPVIATAVGGVPELIVDGESGVLCKTRDVEGISRSVLALINDHHQKRTIGINGKKRVMDCFSFYKRMENIESYYTDLAALP